MVAADVLRGDMPISHWDSTIGEFILDVREPFELAAESHPRAVNIPLGQCCAAASMSCRATARSM